jgi:drug/metabolite transporter (DMT)-like permease
MRDELRKLFPLRSPRQGSAALAGGLLRAVVFIAWVALRMMVIVPLRLLRPFIMWPLVLVMLGGMGFAFAFAASGHWHDAARAGLVAFVAAAALGLYSALVQVIDPGHFNDQVLTGHRNF